MSIPYCRPALVLATLLLGACTVMPTGPSVMVLPGTGQSIERIEADTQRDFWLNTQEALDYGLLGKVIRSVDELK